MENKRKNIYIIIFLITTIIASCLAIYFVINSDKEKEELKVKINELLIKNNEINSTRSTEEKNTEEKVIIPEYDPNTIKNKPKDVKYGEFLGDCDVAGVSATFSIEGKVKVIKYEVEGLTYNYNDGKEIEVKGLSNEKIIDINKGTAGSGEMAFIWFLTEKGEVYYSVDDLWSIKNTINVEKLSGISNICRIERVDSTRVAYIDGEEMTSARMTFIGIDINGNCYDLLYEKNGY